MDTNFTVNLVEGRSLKYGIQGPLWYVQALLSNWGGGILVLGAFAAIGTRKAPAAGASAAAIVLVHSLVAHKEYSFIYAAIPLVLILAGLGAAALVVRSGGGSAGTAGRPRFTLYALAVCLALALIAGVGGGYRDGALAGSVNLRMMSVVRKLPDMCGLALHFAGWPSYAVIDRKIPTYLPQSADDLSRLRSAANYFVVGEAHIGDVPWAKPLQCQGGLCLLHSPVACTAAPTWEANEVIAREGF